MHYSKTANAKRACMTALPRVSWRCSPAPRLAPQIAGRPADDCKRFDAVYDFWWFSSSETCSLWDILLLGNLESIQHSFQDFFDLQNACRTCQPAVAFKHTLSSVASSASPEPSLGRPLAVSCSEGRRIVGVLVSSALSIVHSSRCGLPKHVRPSCCLKTALLSKSDSLCNLAAISSNVERPVPRRSDRGSSSFTL